MGGWEESSALTGTGKKMCVKKVKICLCGLRDVPQQVRGRGRI